MSQINTLKQFKAGQVQEALQKWKDSLEENALDPKSLTEIEKGKNAIQGLNLDEALKKVAAEGLELLSAFYRIAPCDPIRKQKGGREMGSPGDIRIHPDGRIVIADETKHRIEFYSKEGVFLSSFGENGSRPGQFFYPKKLYCASNGVIYVADAWNHRIQSFGPDGSFLSEFGKYGDEFAAFNEPHGITQDVEGWTYILDRCNHRVQALDRDFKLIGSFGRRGTPFEENMAYLFSSPANQFTAPAFEFPTAIETDSQGNLYIADCNNHRIQKFNRYGSKITEWGHKGSAKGAFMYPQAIAIDRQDNIFVADMNNKRVQRFSTNGELLYAFKIPGSETDSMVAPTALSCSEGRLYIGLGFSPQILIFEYNSQINGCLKELKDKFGTPETAQGKSALELIRLGPGADLDKGGFPQGQIDFVNRLQKETASLEEEIKTAFDEWFEITSPLISANNERELQALRGNESDLEFDENLFRLERKDVELARTQKLNLTQFKRLNENIYQNRSEILSKCQAEHLPVLTPFYEALLAQIKRLASFQAALYSKREKIHTDMKKTYPLFMNERDKYRGEFKLSNQQLSILHFGMGQVNQILGLLLIALKDWVVFIKNNRGLDFEWGKLYQEVFFGKLGAGLETILSKSLYDVGSFIFISNRIQSLAAVFPLADIDPSCFTQASFAQLFQKTAEDAKPALSPFIASPFLSQTKGGGILVGPYFYDCGAMEKSGKSIESAFNFLLEFSKGGTNLSIPVKAFIENEIGLMQNKVSKETVLSSAAVTDEKVAITETDNWLLIDFQEKQNYMAIEKLFLGLKWDYRTLFPILFYLKKTEPGKLGELLPFLEKSLEEYIKLHGELYKKEVEKKIELSKFDPNPCATELQLDPATRAKKEELRKITSGTHGLLEFIVIRLAELVDLHERLNSIAGKPVTDSYPHGAIKKIKPRPDLVIGEGGSMFGQLDCPTAIEVDNNGLLAICSSCNQSVKKFTLDGIPVSEIGGYGTMPLSFIKPNSIIFDPQGNAFISDFPASFGPSNIRAQKLSPQGKHILTIGGIGSDELKAPSDLLLDSLGRLWISDMIKNQVRVYSKDGQFIKTIGKEGNGPGEFRAPWGLELMDNGDIAVSESGNGRIQILDQEGNNKGFCSTGDRELKDVFRLAKGPGGTLFASDYSENCIYFFDEKYQLISYFGSHGKDFGKFNGPTGLKYYNEYLFVCENLNHRVQRFQIKDII